MTPSYEAPPAGVVVPLALVLRVAGGDLLRRLLAERAALDADRDAGADHAEVGQEPLVQRRHRDLDACRARSP